MVHKISVSALVLFEYKLLMIRESQNGVISWDIPAGGVDSAETLDNAVVREVFEESRVAITNPVLIRTFCFIEAEMTTVNFLYIAKLNELIVEKNRTQSVDEEEILDVKFFSITEVVKLIDQGKYEHNLAKARLEVFVNQSYDTSHLTPIIVRS
jgi:ADP-ribose pyrophosphatase YjhB (NUDIX family)